MFFKRLVVILIIFSIFAFDVSPALGVPPQSPEPQPPQPSQPPASPTPQTSIQEALTNQYQLLSQVKDQISILDKELEISTETYNLAKEQLDKTQQELEKMRQELKRAQKDYLKQKDIFRERISEIYKGGETHILEILLDTEDFSDFILRVRFLASLTQQDAELTTELREQKERIKKAEKKQEDLRQEQLRVTQELDLKRIEIEKKLADRAIFSQSIDLNIRALLEQEAREISGEQQALVQQILQNPESLNIDAQPGSIVRTAIRYLGIPYLWAGASPVTGFDCSGFTQYVFAQHGVYLIHYSRSQFAQGIPVALEDLMAGDLVFFGNPIHHLGMYIGAGYFIHAPRTGDFVKISRLSGYSEYAGARRYPLQNRF